MQKLKYWELSKYNEIPYIKKFVDGISKQELEALFYPHLLNGFLATLIGTTLANINKKEVKENG